MKAELLREDDYANLSVFLGKVLGRPAHDFVGLFGHWWKANPAWDASMPRGWIVRTQMGNIIAFTANIPFNYVSNGIQLLCFATGSTSVDERWRGRGLSKLVGLSFLSQKNAALLVGTGSTQIAYKVWLSLGMRPVQRCWHNSSFMMLADLSTWAGTKFRNRGYPVGLGAALGRVAAKIIESRRPTPTVRAFRVENGFAEGDDKQLKLCCASTAYTTYAARNAKILNWLYFGSPIIRQTRAVFVARRGPNLVGYLAMKRDKTAFLLLECRTLKGDPAIAKDLIWAARDYAMQQGTPYVRIWRYSPMIAEAVPLFGGIVTRSPAMATYCIKSNIELNDAFFESTPGDGDICVI